MSFLRAGTEHLLERGRADAMSCGMRKGRLGFILPHKFFNAQYGEPLRGVIAKGKHLAKVVHFGDQQVFENATTYTCLMFLDKAGHDEFEFEKVENLKAWRLTQTSEVLETSEVLIGKINASRVTESEWNFLIEMIISHHKSIKSLTQSINGKGILDLVEGYGEASVFERHSERWDEWSIESNRIIEHFGYPTKTLAIEEAHNAFNYVLEYCEHMCFGWSEWRGLLNAADHFASALVENTKERTKMTTIKGERKSSRGKTREKGIVRVRFSISSGE